MLPFFEKKDVELFRYDFRDFVFPAHLHASPEVIFVEEGQINLRIENEVYTVGQGEVAIVFPNLVHSYEWSDIAENKGYLLLLGQRLLGEYKDDLTNFRPSRPVKKLDELHEDCARAARVLHDEAGEDIRLQKAYARLFLCRMMRELTLLPRKPLREDLLHSLIDYMGANFRENLSLGSVAEALYVSKYTVSGIFSKSMGMNFNDYLNALRINLAMQLIETGNSSITDICYEVGFSNVRTFNRAFMKNCGLTPSEYRKNIR